MADAAPLTGYQHKRFQRLLADRMRELFRAHVEAPPATRLIALLQGFDGSEPATATGAPTEAPPLRAL